MRSFILPIAAFAISLPACSAASGGEVDLCEQEPGVPCGEAPTVRTAGQTSAPSLLLAGPNPHVETATSDRSRVVVRTAPEGQDCGQLSWVEVPTRTALPITGEGNHCASYAQELVAMNDTGNHAAYWRWSASNQSFELVLWTHGAGATMVASHPGDQGTNELRGLYFSASHLLYNLRGPNDTYRLMAYDLASGTTSTLSTNVTLTQPVFDATRTKLLMREDGMGDRILVLHDLAAGTSVEVASGVDWDQHVSADRRHVAVLGSCSFGEGLCELTVLDFDTGAVSTPDTDVTTIAGFTADGDQLVYASGGALKVWNVSGGNPSPIGGEDVCWAATAPAGERVAFASECEGDPHETRGTLQVADAAGQAPVTELARGMTISRDPATQPRFSPDGERIAAIHERAFGTSSYLKVWDLATGTLERVGDQMLMGVARGIGRFAFAPDGSTLIFERHSSWVGPCPPYGTCGYVELRGYDFNRTVWRGRWLAGGMWQMINADGAFESVWGRPVMPARSPDESLLTFTSNAGTPLSAVYLLDLAALDTERVARRAYAPALLSDTHLLLTDRDGLYVSELE